MILMIEETKGISLFSSCHFFYLAHALLFYFLFFSQTIFLPYFLLFRYTAISAFDFKNTNNLSHNDYNVENYECYYKANYNPA